MMCRTRPTSGATRSRRRTPADRRSWKPRPARTRARSARRRQRELHRATWLEQGQAGDRRPRRYAPASILRVPKLRPRRSACSASAPGSIPARQSLFPRGDINGCSRATPEQPGPAVRSRLAGLESAGAQAASATPNTSAGGCYLYTISRDLRAQHELRASAGSRCRRSQSPSRNYRPLGEALDLGIAAVTPRPGVGHLRAEKIKGNHQSLAVMWKPAASQGEGAAHARPPIATPGAPISSGTPNCIPAWHGLRAERAEAVTGCKAPSRSASRPASPSAVPNVLGGSLPARSAAAAARLPVRRAVISQV